MLLSIELREMVHSVVRLLGETLGYPLVFIYRDVDLGHRVICGAQERDFRDLPCQLCPSASTCRIPAWLDSRSPSFSFLPFPHAVHNGVDHSPVFCVAGLRLQPAAPPVSDDDLGRARQLLEKFFSAWIPFQRDLIRCARLMGGFIELFHQARGEGSTTSIEDSLGKRLLENCDVVAWRAILQDNEIPLRFVPGRGGKATPEAVDVLRALQGFSRFMGNDFCPIRIDDAPFPLVSEALFGEENAHLEALESDCFAIPIIPPSTLDGQEHQRFWILIVRFRDQQPRGDQVDSVHLLGQLALSAWVNRQQIECLKERERSVRNLFRSSPRN